MIVHMGGFERAHMDNFFHSPIATASLDGFAGSELTRLMCSRYKLIEQKLCC
jgi:hypothetical protein